MSWAAGRSSCSQFACVPRHRKLVRHGKAEKEAPAHTGRAGKCN